MIKEFLSSRKNRTILISALVVLLVLVVILCICLSGNSVSRMPNGIEYTKVKSFGKGVGFPGTVYKNDIGELRILIKNDTNTYFVVGEQSDELSIVSDTCTEDGKFYQQFRVGCVIDDDSSAQDNQASDNANLADGVQFILENSPKSIAFVVNVAIDEDGKVSFSNITENKNYTSSEDTEEIAALKSQYGEVGFVDRISIVSTGEHALNDGSAEGILGNNLMVYYKDKYIDMFVTDAANEQKLLDHYKDIAEASAVTVGDISLNILKSEFAVSGVFTKDGVACLINGFEEESALTGFVKSLAN